MTHLQQGDVAEVWACPECGAEYIIGVGTGTPRSTSPPRCTLGHATREMEQRIERADHKALIERAANDPDIRIDLT